MATERDYNEVIRQQKGGGGTANVVIVETFADVPPALPYGTIVFSKSGT